MGCYDVYCILCGNFAGKYVGFLYDIYYDDEIPPNATELNREFYKLSNWMREVSLLLVNGDVIHKCKEIVCSVVFESNGDTYLGVIYDNIKYFDKKLEFRNQGLPIHTDCWQYLCNKYKRKITLQDLPPTVALTNKINYGKISDYWMQDTNYKDMMKENKYMICKPTTNKKNDSRINKIISQFKIKNAERKSPSVSATFYKENVVKKGNDENFWQIKKGRWVKINDTITTYRYKKKRMNSKINYAELNKIPQMGIIGKQLLFVKDFSDKEIIFIGTDKTIDTLKKNLLI